MGVFYVYLIYRPEPHKRDGDWGRWLLIFSSRLASNEFFHDFQNRKNESGEPYFATWSRASPQLWFYNIRPNESDTVIFNTAFRSLSTVMRMNVSATLLEGGFYETTGSNWPIIPALNGLDWIDGRIFSIRNKNQPEYYWSVEAGRIFASNQRRNSFRIATAGTQHTVNQQKILIGTNLVTVEWVDRDTNERQFVVTASYAESGHGYRSLAISTTPSAYHFKDIIYAFRHMHPRSESRVAAIYYIGPGEGEEWEPC